ncbi:MAG: hypothetical protein NDI88_06435 [Lysobacter sp.]|nr:hypothetical protein [Lysobacter sp.]
MNADATPMNADERSVVAVPGMQARVSFIDANPDMHWVIGVHRRGIGVHRRSHRLLPA